MLHRPRHRLFFALRPPRDAAEYIAWEQYRFGPGRGVRPEHFHITSAIVEDCPVYPTDIVARMLEAGNAIGARAFRVVLNRVAASRRSVAMRPSEPLPVLDAFHRQIAQAMADMGVAMRPGWRFNPHLTLLYRDGTPFNVPVDALSWQAAEFVLIHSWVGLTRHDVLASWPLRGTLH